MKRRALLYVVSLVSSVACFYGDQLSANLQPLEHTELSTNLDFEEEEEEEEDDDERGGRLCGFDSRCDATAHTSGTSFA